MNMLERLHGSFRLTFKVHVHIQAIRGVAVRQQDRGNKSLHTPVSIFYMPVSVLWAVGQVHDLDLDPVTRPCQSHVIRRLISSNSPATQAHLANLLDLTMGPHTLLALPPTLIGSMHRLCFCRSHINNR